MYRESIRIGNDKYEVLFDIGTFGHLCTMRELYEFSIRKETYDPKFGTGKLQEVAFTEVEYKIFKLLFVRALKDNYFGSKNLLLTIGTGTHVCWSYMVKQTLTLPNLLKLLPIASTMVLYHKDSNAGDYEVANGVSDCDVPEELTTGVELTMFNIDTKKLLSEAENKEVLDYVASKEVVEVAAITEELVLNYLKGL